MIYNYLKCYLLLIVSRMASNNQVIESGQQRHQTSIMKTTHIYMILISI